MDTVLTHLSFIVDNVINVKDTSNIQRLLKPFFHFLPFHLSGKIKELPVARIASWHRKLLLFLLCRSLKSFLSLLNTPLSY